MSVESRRNAALKGKVATLKADLDTMVRERDMLLDAVERDDKRIRELEGLLDKAVSHAALVRSTTDSALVERVRELEEENQRLREAIARHERDVKGQVNAPEETDARLWQALEGE